MTGKAVQRRSKREDESISAGGVVVEGRDEEMKQRGRKQTHEHRGS